MVELWHLSDINWLEQLPQESAVELRNAAKVLTFGPGATVFEPEPEPRSVFILETGLVRMYRRSSRGEEVTLGYVQPGEVFGELAAFSDKPRESYAVAVETSTVIKVDRRVFADAIQARSSIVFTVATQIEDRFKQIESRVEDLVFRSARERVARIVLQLIDDFGKRTGNQVLVDLRLTHEELAKLAGTSRPTVSIALGEFEDEGLLTRSNGKLVVLDPAALRAEADRQSSTASPP